MNEEMQVWNLTDQWKFETAFFPIVKPKVDYKTVSTAFLEWTFIKPVLSTKIKFVLLFADRWK